MLYKTLFILSTRHAYRDNLEIEHVHIEIRNGKFDIAYGKLANLFATPKTFLAVPKLTHFLST